MSKDFDFSSYNRLSRDNIPIDNPSTEKPAQVPEETPHTPGKLQGHNADIQHENDPTSSNVTSTAQKRLEFPSEAASPNSKSLKGKVSQALDGASSFKQRIKKTFIGQMKNLFSPFFGSQKSTASPLFNPSPSSTSNVQADTPPPIPDTLPPPLPGTPPIPDSPPPPIPDTPPPPIPDSPPPPIPDTPPPPIPDSLPPPIPDTPPPPNTIPLPLRTLTRRALPSIPDTPPPIPNTPPPASSAPKAPISALDKVFEEVIKGEKKFHADLNHILGLAQFLKDETGSFADDNLKSEITTIMKNISEVRNASRELETAFENAKTNDERASIYNSDTYAKYSEVLGKHMAEGDHLKKILDEFTTHMQTNKELKGKYEAFETNYLEAAKNLTSHLGGENKQGQGKISTHLMVMNQRLARHKLHLGDMNNVYSKQGATQKESQEQKMKNAEQMRQERAGRLPLRRNISTPAAASYEHVTKEQALQFGIKEAQETTAASLNKQNKALMLAELTKQIESSDKLVTFMSDKLQSEKEKFLIIETSVQDFKFRIQRMKDILPQIEEFANKGDNEPLDPQLQATIDQYKDFLRAQTKTKLSLQDINEGNKLGVFSYFESLVLKKGSRFGESSKISQYMEMKNDYEQATRVIL